MHSYNRIIIAITAALCLFSGVAYSVDAESASHEKWSQAVTALDHENYFEREKAVAILKQAGIAALPALSQGVKSANPEIEWRCVRLLEYLALEGDDATFEKVVSQLKATPVTGKSGWVKLVADLQTRRVTYRHDMAVAKLHALGAEVYTPRERELAAAAIDFGDVIADFEMVEADFVEPVPVDDWIGLLEEEVEGSFTEVVELEEELEVSAGFELAKLPVPRAGEVPTLLLPRAFQEEEEASINEAAPPPPDAEAAEFPVAKLGALIRRAVELAPALPLAPDVPLEPGQVLPVPIAELEPIGVHLHEFDAPLEVMDGFDMAMPVAFIDETGNLSDSPGLMYINADWRGGDQDLSALKDVRELHTLHLEHARLTDAALEHIGRIADLTHVQIRGVPFTREALLKFRRNHPKVSVMALGPAMMGVNCDLRQSPCTLQTVPQNTGAAEAGLQPGDVILKVDGQEIRDFSELTMHVYSHKPGDVLQVVYQRGVATQEVSIKLKPRAE
jgi:hypothetical protein